MDRWGRSRGHETPRPPAVEDVGIDHRGSDGGVAEELLDRANVVAGFEEVGRERTAEGGRTRGRGGGGFRRTRDGRSGGWT